MSGIRSLTRRAAVAGVATSASAPIYVDSADNAVKVVPAGSGTTPVTLGAAVSSSGNKYAAGVGTFVTGTLLIATGLAGVLSFQATLTTNPSGATAAASAQLIVATITGTTGAVTATAYSITSVTGAVTAANTATGSFSWVAIGM